MRWGLRVSSRQQTSEAQHPRRDQKQQADSKGKSNKAVFSSFSPLAWLSKLTARNSGAAAAKPEQATPASAAKSTAQATLCFHKPASTSPASASATASRSSPSGSSSSSAAAAAGGTARAVAADIAPRRLSVGNDDTGESADAAAARHLYRRRHYSVGGDRDLLPPTFGNLISLSRSASPKPPQPTPAPVRTLMAPTTTLPPLPSDTDEDGGKRRQRSRRRRRVAGRRSFSSSYGKAAPGGVRVLRSPRVSELERFAVVRRTRDPQREFRASMVEMIASKRMAGRPEELETLLACYLSLNADEHHDCIVKVFRQLWFDLNNNKSARAAPSPRGYYMR